jgi:hypothetical protein
MSLVKLALDTVKKLKCCCHCHSPSVVPPSVFSDQS